MSVVKKYLVKPGTRVHLSQWKTQETNIAGDEKELRKKCDKLNDELMQLHQLLYAQHKYKILVIFQAMDAGGKDGTIKHVFRGLNPQGVQVESFKVPSTREFDHDYLQRVHHKTPGKGEIVIFNRSHYEDVLVPMVHDLVPPRVWHRRYRHINEFERMLSDEETVILKFFLHVSEKEQKKRLVERIKDPRKAWKFNKQDIEERQYWSKYMKAYQDAFRETSTKWAPWHIIPADDNSVRNWIVSKIIVKELKKLNMSYPPMQLSPTEIKKFCTMLA